MIKRFALVSRENGSRPSRKCSHRKRSRYTIVFCWNFYPERKSMRGRDANKNSSNNKIGAESSDTENKNEEKKVLLRIRFANFRLI